MIAIHLDGRDKGLRSSFSAFSIKLRTTILMNELFMAISACKDEWFNKGNASLSGADEGTRREFNYNYMNALSKFPSIRTFILLLLLLSSDKRFAVLFSFSFEFRTSVGSMYAAAPTRFLHRSTCVRINIGFEKDPEEECVGVRRNSSDSLRFSIRIRFCPTRGNTPPSIHPYVYLSIRKF